LPSIPGFQLAARFHAGGEAFDVGGDFYDVFETGDDTWAVVIGDVVGHGADAAALTALIRYTARAAAMRESRPSRVLSTVNDALHRQRRSDEQFCTALYASVDPRTTPARILLANGGHPPALVLRADGTVDQVSPPGMLIGAVRELHVVDHPVAIGPGDALLLYTDGVTEARMDGEPFGEERLRALLESCAGMDAEGIVEHIEQTVVGLEGHPRDDVALLALRMV
jgi:sigma-B regulation protein RsbU (phosphoserine phosphatase)